MCLGKQAESLIFRDYMRSKAVLQTVVSSIHVRFGTWDPSATLRMEPAAWQTATMLFTFV